MAAKQSDVAGVLATIAAKLRETFEVDIADEEALQRCQLQINAAGKITIVDDNDYVIVNNGTIKDALKELFE